MRTNMREAIPQMTQIGDIGDALDVIKGRLDNLERHGMLDVKESNDQAQLDFGDPYDIGQSDRAEDLVNIPLWVHNNSHDRAVKVRTPVCCSPQIHRVKFSLFILVFYPTVEATPSLTHNGAL
jgi:hypothetical protein